MKASENTFFYLVTLPPGLPSPVGLLVCDFVQHFRKLIQSGPSPSLSSWPKKDIFWRLPLGNILMKWLNTTTDRVQISLGPREGLCKNLLGKVSLLLGKSIGEGGRCESTKHFSLLNLIDLWAPSMSSCGASRHALYHNATKGGHHGKKSQNCGLFPYGGVFSLISQKLFWLMKWAQKSELTP